MLRIKIIAAASALSGALVALACTYPVERHASAAPAASTTSEPRSSRALVLLLATGLEDAQTMGSVFRHARVAAEQKKLDEVTVIVYGRGVQALNGALGARPAQVAQLAKEALAAGVHVKVCANALAQMGVSPENLDPPGVEIIPSAMTAVVDYVARGAAVVRY